MPSPEKNKWSMYVAVTMIAFLGALGSHFAVAQSPTPPVDATSVAQWGLLDQNPLLSIHRSPAFLPPPLQGFGGPHSSAVFSIVSR